VEANRVVELLRAIYNTARRWGLTPAGFENPAGRIDRFRERSRERWLTAPELKRLAAAINREADPWVEAALHLLLLTGSRKTELLRARWDRVDFDSRRLLLEDTKTGEPKVVPLSAPALEILRDIPRRLRSPWVFPGPNGTEPLQDLKRPWARIRKRAKLKDARLHDLRRTTGSWLVQRGVPLGVIGQALGHRDPRATAVYARIAAHQPAEALEMLGEALIGIMQRPPSKAGK
jgi:integrase